MALVDVVDRLEAEVDGEGDQVDPVLQEKIGNVVITLPVTG
jgi:hypothetical protein